jgi:membrane protein DedA with SNARE-associated domain/rhodanese-related sulfurtransferase
MHDLLPLLIAHGIAIVFAITLAARVGAPVPAAPLLVVAGGIATAGRISLMLCLAVAIVANVIGDAVWFQAGRWRGHRVMKLLCQISLSPDTCVRQSENILTRWGGSSLIAAKFLPGVSVVAAPMAGALGMSWQRFLSYAFVAALIWSSLFLAVGVAFSREIDQVLDLMASFGTATAVAIVVALGLLLAYRYARRRLMLSDRYAPRISVHELREMMRRGEVPIVIDVRSQVPGYEDEARVPGALAIALDELPRAAAGLPRDREIVLYCSCPNEASAVRGARLLAEQGVNRTRALKGGLDAWLEIDAASPLQPVPGAEPVTAVFGPEAAR